MVMVGSLRQVDDPRAVSEMNMVQPAEFLEYVKCPVDGGRINLNPGPLRRPGLDVNGRQVLLVALCQYPAYRPPSIRDAKSGGPQCADEDFRRDVHIASRRPVRHCGR